MRCLTFIPPGGRIYPLDIVQFRTKCYKPGSSQRPNVGQKRRIFPQILELVLGMRPGKMYTGNGDEIAVNLVGVVHAGGCLSGDTAEGKEVCPGLGGGGC